MSHFDLIVNVSIPFAVRQRRQPGPADQDGGPARPHVAHQDLARPGHPLGALVPPREGRDLISAVLDSDTTTLNLPVYVY